MNKLIYILLLLNYNFIGAQVNLVPNPSFEDTNHCPWGTNNPSALAQWFNPNTATPDYYNVCDTQYGGGVPYNDWGYQEAFDGNAYVGIITFSDVLPNYREYLSIKLDTNLENNKTYYWCMYVSRLDYTNYASNGLGISFSQSHLQLNNNLIFNFLTPYGYVTEVIEDDKNWIKVSGEFIANGTEKYLIIGNFFDDNQTDVVMVKDSSINGGDAYYYIDNFYLGTNPCLIYNSFVEIPNVFTPNNDGINDLFTLKYNDVDSVNYIIYNCWGNRIFSSTNDNLTWDGNYMNTECTDGIYFCVVSYYNKELKVTEYKQGTIHLLR